MNINLDDDYYSTCRRRSPRFLESPARFFQDESKSPQFSRSVQQGDGSKSPRFPRSIKQGSFQDESKSPRFSRRPQQVFFQDESKSPRFSRRPQQGFFQDERKSPRFLESPARFFQDESKSPRLKSPRLKSPRFSLSIQDESKSPRFSRRPQQGFFQDESKSPRFLESPARFFQDESKSPRLKSPRFSLSVQQGLFQDESNKGISRPNRPTPVSLPSPTFFQDESNESISRPNRPTPVSLPSLTFFQIESNEGESRTNRPMPIPDRWASLKHYLFVGVVTLGLLLALRRPSCSRCCVHRDLRSSDPFYFWGTARDLQMRRQPFCSACCVPPATAFEARGPKKPLPNLQVTAQDKARNNSDAIAFLQDDAPNRCETKDDCDSGEICCRNKCSSCCTNADCASKIDQPPAGEFGKTLCINNECRAYLNDESSQIPSDGYPVWVPSETIDNSKKFRKLNMPRTVYNDGPLMEQVWRIDFNNQDESFDKNNKFKYNGTHITIPSFDPLHTAYSRSYNHYDEHETGITSLVISENTYSALTEFPKLVFIEKYHTLTYDGIKDTTRGDDIKKMAKKQVAENPVFDKTNWKNRATEEFFNIGQLKIIERQVEAGIDKAVAWQVRRYVNSYPIDDVGSVTRHSSESWGRHSKKAKEAINHARNPSFERDYMKSELHCKHFEDLDGVSYTEDTVTFPLGRPITNLSGEMVTSPVHYFGAGVGHITLQYDPFKRVLEIFYQTFAHSRQYSDVKYSGPYPNGLYVAPVADGSEYTVPPDRDGRTDGLFLADPPDESQLGGDEADFTLWARPTEDVCDERLLNDTFWEKMDGHKFDYGSESELGDQLQYSAKGMVSMPCAGTYMRTDYDGGTNFGVEEIGVWHHSIIEIRGDQTRDLLLGTFWDDWECFYRKEKCHS